MLNAVDLCYKAMHVLHAEYSPVCEQVWLLLQKAIYHQETDWDRKITGVNTILRMLKDMQ